MAIDSENKRRSVSNWFCRIPPAPDGAIAGVDKQHIAGFYSGIPAGAGTPFPLNISISQSLEYGISISQSLEYGISISQSGGGT